MKRPRPYIPISIRLKVAERQYRNRYTVMPTTQKSIADGVMAVGPDGLKLKTFLQMLFGGAPVDLDHNPPLRARTFSKRTGKYTPDANDPDHLEYRLKAPEANRSHYIKTYVRGDRGQFPDRVLIKRERRREKPKKKRKTKWASRPMRGRTSWPTRSFR